jgi:hypothetical protein
MATEHSISLWPSLKSIFGEGSFDDSNRTNRWTAFYAPGSRHAQSPASEWKQLQTMLNDVATAAQLNLSSNPVLDADVNALDTGPKSSTSTSPTSIKDFFSKW